jgi:FixJ family two-component response regulator
VTYSKEEKQVVEPTIYHVDDDVLIRRTVEFLARSVQVAYRGYGTAQSFLESDPPDGPGCVLTDLRMPGLSGMELLRRCVDRAIGMPVIIFTAHAEVPLAVHALKSGAFDFLQKPAGEQAMLETIQAALLFDARRLIEKKRHEVTAARVLTLTPGEREVLDLLVQGRANKVIASELGISYKTVEARRTKLMEKMEAETIADLIAAVLSYRLWAENQRRR